MKGINLKKWARIIFISMILPLAVINTTGCGASKKAKAAEEARLAKEREERIKREEADRKRREEEDKKRAMRAPYQKMEDFFQKVASAPNIDAANNMIDKAMTQFASPNTPVLIIIKRTGDIIDYDKPTTARQYFDFMKDQKKAFNKVDHLDFDSDGKIKEMVLITQ